MFAKTRLAISIVALWAAGCSHVASEDPERVPLKGTLAPAFVVWDDDGVAFIESDDGESISNLEEYFDDLDSLESGQVSVPDRVSEREQCLGNSAVVCAELGCRCTVLPGYGAACYRCGWGFPI